MCALPRNFLLFLLILLAVTRNAIMGWSGLYQSCSETRGLVGVAACLEVVGEVVEVVVVVVEVCPLSRVSNIVGRSVGVKNQQINFVIIILQWSLKKLINISEKNPKRRTIFLLHNYSNKIKYVLLLQKYLGIKCNFL